MRVILDVLLESLDEPLCVFRRRNNSSQDLGLRAAGLDEGKVEQKLVLAVIHQGQVGVAPKGSTWIDL